MEAGLYEKVLVARHSPENRCYAHDGEILIVVPRKTIPQEATVPHHFISADDGRTKSKYGWVKKVERLTLGQFLEHYLRKSEVSESQREHIRIMLASIQRLPPETPVAATYRSRGTIEQRMELTVHKVAFYRER